MPHSIFAKFQPVSQRIVSDPAHRARRHRVDPVLFLPYAACVQSVEFDGLEAIRNLRTSLSSRLRLSGGSVGCDPSLVGWSLTLQLSSFKSGAPGLCGIGRILKGPVPSLQQRIRRFRAGYVRVQVVDFQALLQPEDVLE
jgi:hypothetical protein